MTLRLTPDETDALRKVAQREGRSMQEVARAAINEYVTRRTARRNEHLTTIIAQDAELLRRLGTW